MSTTEVPDTLVDETKTPIDETLILLAQDGVQEVLEKGLYNVPDNRIVLILDGSEIIAVSTAGKLRSEILPRSWSGSLQDYSGRLLPPPEIVANTRVAALAYLIQSEPHAEWLLVIDDEAGFPVGVLSRATVLSSLPPPDATPNGGVLRTGPLLLWSDPSIEHVYYYCPIEKRCYGPHAAHPGPAGKMRDRRGHLLEKREPSGSL